MEIVHDHIRNERRPCTSTRAFKSLWIVRVSHYRQTVNRVGWFSVCILNISYKIKTLNPDLWLHCRPLLKQIKNSAEAHIILDCNTEKIYEVLKQAQQIGMMSDYHSYLITSLVSWYNYCYFLIRACI